MRKTAVVQMLMVTAVLAGCAGKTDTATDTTAAMAAPAMAAPKTAADFAGTWQQQVVLTGVDKPVPSTVTGSADGSTWTMSLEGRPNIALTASISGDSLVLVSAEYESVLRKGVMVTTRSAAVMTNGALAGNVVATYKTATGQEVVTGTSSGTRAP